MPAWICSTPSAPNPDVMYSLPAYRFVNPAKTGNHG
jgi:hypothetical protein